MNARETVRVDAIKRVGAFGVKNAADWTPTAPAPATPAQANAKALFAALNTPKTGVIARLDGHGTDQQSGAAGFHGGTTSKSVQRDGILEAMKMVNEGGAAIAEAQRRPELMDGFRMPHGVSDEVLGNRARSFAEKAAAIEADLVKLGLPEDFIADLEQRVEDFGGADDEQSGGLEDQVGARGGLGSTIREGLTVLKQLRVLMKNLYRGDAVKTGAWMTAQHIERVGSSGKKKAKPGPVPPVAPGT